MTDKAVIKTEETQSSGFLAVIDKAVAGNMSADTIHKLIDAQERVLARQGEMNFNSAMAKLQPLLPVIQRTAKGHNSMYAKYEDIDRQIRPLYTAAGFSVSFNSKKNEDQSITYFGTLSHVDGYSRTAEIDLPPDASGSKNAIQAKGSTISYAKRYLITMLLNIVTCDEDDDGDTSEPINQEQLDEIRALIDEVEANVAKFCEFMKVKALPDIQARDFDKAKNALKAKKVKK